ncbi:LADA_0F08746g1_1 [Lachancea dasiensis]|uniref:LADA_0F08746g1_1 n=1 Tax=Lachancea dasiensis TaxID=1072105 RepID=A0A1G4JKU2_9SACH|nr:LADA_0F08746g1_1 [Lachancea dasiensis]
MSLPKKSVQEQTRDNEQASDNNGAAKGARTLSEILREVKKPEIRPVLQFQKPSVAEIGQHHSQLPGGGMARDSGPVRTAVMNNTSRPPSATHHECFICRKTFSRPSALNTHVLIHTGHQPYICDVAGCGKRFNVKSNLMRHKKIHKKSQQQQQQERQDPHGE